jgi:UDP-N-acetylglucosamine 1-carboxyvinyltransferase
MSYYKIQGGRQLCGAISVNSPKNSALALLAASLLNKNTTELFNFPELEETKRIIEVLKSIGVKIEQPEPRRLVIQPPKKILIDKINYQSAVKTRSVLLLLGPLIHQFKTFNLPKSGGCKLGARTVSPHLYALEHFGVDIKSTSRHYVVNSKIKKPGRDIVLYESGDTVTENALMAAALINGKTTIKFASANYQIQELCYFLEKLGVKIDGLGSTTITVRGRTELNRPVKYTLAEDPIEAMLFISLAIVTDSVLTVKRCPIDFIELELLKLEKMGLKYKMSKKYKSRNGRTDLVDIKIFSSKLKAPEEKIYGRPFPGLNIDNLPFFVPIATQAKGQTLIHDWVYENRAIYYAELTKLGARITLADPHRAYVTGPTKLKAGEIICPPALRPAAIILISMLAGRGQSILRNAYSIERGYENLINRLRHLGAKIEKVNDS